MLFVGAVCLQSESQALKTSTQLHATALSQAAVESMDQSSLESQAEAEAELIAEEEQLLNSRLNEQEAQKNKFIEVVTEQEEADMKAPVPEEHPRAAA